MYEVLWSGIFHCIVTITRSGIALLAYWVSYKFFNDLVAYLIWFISLHCLITHYGIALLAYWLSSKLFQ